MANNTPLCYGDYSSITQPVTYSPKVEHNYHISLHGIVFFPNNIAAVVSLLSFAIPCRYTLLITTMNTLSNNEASIPSSSSITYQAQHTFNLFCVCQQMCRSRLEMMQRWALSMVYFDNPFHVVLCVGCCMFWEGQDCTEKGIC